MKTTRQAFQLILFLGTVSLLGDIIYEGARGVSGQYLNVLGVNAATVGFVVGLGEFLGYAFRLISGFFADKTRAYWLFTIVGYGLLISIPLISLTGSWQIVTILIILERIGKGIRTPARDTIASYAAKRVGSGVGFGISELLDQIGATIGPLIFAFGFANLAAGQNVASIYQHGYSLFWIPFVLLLWALFVTYTKFRDPERFEVQGPERADDKKISRSFWLYALFVFITTTGFISFALVGFHLKDLGIMNDASIALLYAGAMAVDAAAGLVTGRLYDRLKSSSGKRRSGFLVLLALPLLAALVPFFVFSESVGLILVGVALFGLVLGMQETILKAIVADITHVKKRSTGYGIFNVAFGLAFFIGSSLAGLLYEVSLPLLMIIFAVIELCALPVLNKMVAADQ